MVSVAVYVESRSLEIFQRQCVRRRADLKRDSLFRRVVSAAECSRYLQQVIVCKVRDDVLAFAAVVDKRISTRAVSVSLPSLP